VEKAPPPPETLKVFLRTAPEMIVRSLTVLSAAVSLTDEVASLLLGQNISSRHEPKTIINCLRACDFIVEPDGEWYIEPSARMFFIGQLRGEPGLEAEAHRALQNFTLRDERKAGVPLPAYLSSKAGLAYHTAVADPDRGLEIYVEAYQEADESHNDDAQWLLGVLAEEQQELGILPESAIEPAFFRGMTAYHEGQWQQAERYFSRVVRSDAKRLEIAYAAHLLGRILQQYRREDEEAERLFRRSLELRVVLGDLQGEAHVLHSLGNLIADKNYGEAERLMRRSLELREKLQDWQGEAQVLHSLGNLIARDNSSEAEELLSRSLRLRESKNDLVGIAQVLNSLGRLLKRRSPRQAEEYLRRSLGIDKRLGNLQGQAKALQTLANIVRQRDSLEAESLLRSSLEIERRIGNPRGEAQVLHSLATLIGPRDSEEAVRLLRRSLDIEKRLRNERGQAMVLKTLGDLLRNSGKWDQARESYEQALELKLGLRDRADIHFGLSHIAEKYDRDRPSAIQHMEEALKLARNARMPGDVNRYTKRLRSLKH
jgi:tetratricopeptide (TPR) repeat protein